MFSRALVAFLLVALHVSAAPIIGARAPQAAAPFNGGQPPFAPGAGGPPPFGPGAGAGFPPFGGNNPFAPQGNGAAAQQAGVAGAVTAKGGKGRGQGAGAAQGANSQGTGAGAKGQGAGAAGAATTPAAPAGGAAPATGAAPAVGAANAGAGATDSGKTAATGTTASAAADNAASSGAAAANGTADASKTGADAADAAKAGAAAANSAPPAGGAGGPPGPPSVDCQLSRLLVGTNTIQTKLTLDRIAPFAVSDATALANIKTAVDSISKAQQNIATLAKAASTQTPPPQDVFDDVTTQFTAAGKALGALSTLKGNATVTDLVAQAQNEFLGVQQGAQGVLKSC